MCGFVTYAGSDLSEQLLTDSNDRLAHRGPDDSGVIIDKDRDVGLAHCRLSIIDIEGGQQPMTRGEVSLVYNGEIYNYRELRDELAEKGHSLETESDTEVVLEAYREWGVGCVTRFRGMFSFVIWDRNEDRMYLARDRFGQKPLFYSDLADSFAAGSEIQGLLKLPSIDRTLDRQSVPLYLGLQYIPSPASGFESIRKLPPAHHMVVEDREIKTIERYWTPEYTPKSDMNFSEASEELDKRLSKAVKLRLRSDVPLGAFLSGGIDSSIIVALMSQFSSEPVRTFFINFRGKENNEKNVARAVSERYGTDHTEFQVTPEVKDLLPELARHFGEPFADSSAIPAYYVARETRREVKVALSGDGGDELFGGYGLYEKMSRRQHIRAWLPDVLSTTMANVARGLPGDEQGRSPYHKGRLLMSYLDRDAADWYSLLASYFTSNQLDSVLKEGVGDPWSADTFCRDSFDSYEAIQTDAERAMAHEAGTYLPDDLMVKVDVATMMNSLECRSPLLDHRVAEWATQLPMDFKLASGHGNHKRILRETYRDDLPSEVLSHPKRGFGIPRAKWLREDLSGYLENVLRRQTGFRELFHWEPVERMLNTHQSGNRNYGAQLWALMMFQLWMDEMDVSL